MIGMNRVSLFFIFLAQAVCDKKAVLSIFEPIVRKYGAFGNMIERNI